DHDGFTDGGVPHPALAKFVHKTFGDLEDPSIIRNILTHDDQFIVAVHGLFKALGDGIHKTDVLGFPLGLHIGVFEFVVHIPQFPVQVKGTGGSSNANFRWSSISVEKPSLISPMSSWVSSPCSMRNSS